MPQINTIKNLKQSNQYFKMLEQEKKIESLERNIGQMKKNIENIQNHKYKHLDQLGITLRTLDVNPYFINKITKKLLL